MAYVNPTYLVTSIFALLAALYPAPWHLRTRNIATLSMIFWMTALNIVHTVNCVVWSDNNEIKGSVWGDITATIVVGYNFGLPLSHLILAKQLESYTSLRPRSPLYDPNAKRRQVRFDLSLAIIGPIIGILVHLSNMDRRFYIVEKFGPMPATYWDTWGVIWMAILPICIAGGCATYTIMALVNIRLRRQQMLSMIASDASVNRNQFYRLMFLTLAELGTCGLRAIFNLLSFQNGPQPLGHLGPPRHNLTVIERIDWDIVTSTGRTVLNLQYFTVIACSFVFFLCFATSSETKNFYWRVLHTVMPCIPENHRKLRLGSITHNRNKSNPTSSGGSYSDYNPKSLASSPTTSKNPNDVSLFEMLGTPTINNGVNSTTPAKSSNNNSTQGSSPYQLEKHSKWSHNPNNATQTTFESTSPIVNTHDDKDSLDNLPIHDHHSAIAPFQDPRTIDHDHGHESSSSTATSVAPTVPHPYASQKSPTDPNRKLKIHVKVETMSTKSEMFSDSSSSKSQLTSGRAI